MKPKIYQIPAWTPDTETRITDVYTKQPAPQSDLYSSMSNLIATNPSRMKSAAELKGLPEGYTAQVRASDGNWRDMSNKEGRRALAGDLGLPNVKKKHRG